MTTTYDDLLFEISKPGRIGYSLPESSIEKTDLTNLVSDHLIREEPAELPELSELQVMRHYTGLSNKNFGIETGFYPLGSCTMKYNPKINEDIARYPGFAQIHPLQPEKTAQGALEMMYRLEENLKEVTGMDAISLQPAAGAQGEWAGLLIFKAYHQANGEGDKRRKILVPDSAHGTNPASAIVAGYDVVEIKSNKEGRVGVEALKAAVGPDTAGLMLTNPNTLGLFEVDIVEIAQIVHEAGGLLYYDGANANAILGKSTPGEMGFDVVHLNLHKTFSTPHGGGGPGSGPIGVKDYLKDFMPAPRIKKEEDEYSLSYTHPQSIGRVKGYYGNFGVNVRAYSYIRSMGAEGLLQVSEDAVLHANYLKARLEPYYETPYKDHCKHEFVLSGIRQKKLGVRTLDIAKRLLDYGFYAPTVYFPLIVEECLMIEPTETEAKEQLDAFADALIDIAKDAEENPDTVTGAPYTKAVKRLDEVTAARKPIVVYQKN
ncbi:aminomethyl-transferring glycine dehydrogenase subunit GcvPB [Alkalibacterium olivapovliticus]|uniref:Probable glycine dehydrogenase (decarboxylating) subunit 2 n=1 Tax=Alkalibacterium olivapovliticus TaxID=99907 RepID=A0A2T0W7V2_9LACT|nr:aminomethyl-transferring glycine dehydrogenase subunit GcvPB [Alkalibacterium olivapovliticus]PRY82770.1 glycine dehydrogenase subunit 2 [Alkalibacterium olivapovliticus]